MIEEGVVFSKATNPEKKRASVHLIFENISKDYDRMNDLESFGLHRLWKRSQVQAVRASLLSDKNPSNYKVLDVACGTGDIALALAADLPTNCQVTGIDFSSNMLKVAEDRSCSLPVSVPRPQFIHGDALHLPFVDASIDALTISFGLRNLPDYQAALQEFFRVLRPGGHFFCLEASYPTMPVVKPAFRLYFKHIMPRLASLIVNRRHEYQWLNDSTEAFLSKDDLCDLMTECGFTQVSYRNFSLGAAALHSGCKPGV